MNSAKKAEIIDLVKKAAGMLLDHVLTYFVVGAVLMAIIKFITGASYGLNIILRGGLNLAGIVLLADTVFFIIEVLKMFTARKIRAWKVDRRIIRQAKAAGVWDKRPTPLGGRALELKAWEDFKIKREPGETDAELRRRCMVAADNEYADTPRV